MSKFAMVIGDRSELDKNWQDMRAGFKPATDRQQIVTETITTEDRLRGAIMEASNMIVTGHVALALTTLQEAAKL